MQITNPKVFIPRGKNRAHNKVDKLHAEIAQIQKKCKHDYRINNHNRTVHLEESEQVAGVFCYTVFELSCLLCNKLETGSTCETCPQCLGKMKLVNTYPKGSNKFTPPLMEESNDGGERLYRCSTCCLVVAERVQLNYELPKRKR